MSTYTEGQPELLKRLDIPAVLYDGPETLKKISGMTKGSPNTWGAPPFNPYLKHVVDQQSDVYEYHQSFFDNPPDWANPELVPSIKEFFYYRRWHQVNHNFDSFQARGVYDFNDLSPQLYHSVSNAIIGHGSMGENLLAVDVLGMPNGQLAGNTHPWGKRMDVLEDMRRNVDELFSVFKGTKVVSRRDSARSSWDREGMLQIKGVSTVPGQPGVVNGLHMTRTLTLGAIKEHHLHEQSLFTLDLARLSTALQDAIKNVFVAEAAIVKMHAGAVVFNREDEILAIPELYSTINKALKNDDHRTAIPIGTAIIDINTSYPQDGGTLDEIQDARMRSTRHDILDEDGKSTRHNASYELLGLEENFS